ncbi:MAG: hypothetical protein R2874_13335 [Desulfobacterales bacterium]
MKKNTCVTIFWHLKFPVNPSGCAVSHHSVPYERSVSYGTGTAKGPEAILESSQQLELFDGTSIPAEHGIYTHPH